MKETISPAARRVLRDIGDEWQKMPHWVRGSHVAVMIRHGHLEHRQPESYSLLLFMGSYPWLRDGEIRRAPGVREKLEEMKKGDRR